MSNLKTFILNTSTSTYLQVIDNTKVKADKLNAYHRD